MKRPAKPKPQANERQANERLLQRVLKLQAAILAHRDECQGPKFPYDKHETYAPEAKLYAVLESDW